MFSELEIEAKNRGYKILYNGNVVNKNGKSIGTHGSTNYIYFSFRVNKKIVKIYAHRLQAFQKYGDKIYENGIEVRHLDGNLLNNSWNKELKNINANVVAYQNG